MIYRSPYLRIAAVVLLALAAILILSASLRAHAARPAQSESDEWWARVGGLEAWYNQHGYTESPPPAAAPGSSVGVAPAAGSGIGPQSPISVTSVATIHLPYVARNHRSFEFRGVWVTRFDWTGFGITPTTATLDTMVGNIAAANFNAILFQVRGTADSYYAPGLEPWSPRLTGQLTRALGVDPGWNPLAYMVAQAHAQGIQVHAYINVFPVWLCGLGAPPNPVTPTHLFWSLSYSTTWDTWRTWTAAGPDNIDT